MKKLMQWVMPAKNLAALVFAGLVCAYMVAGALIPVVTGVPFNYTVPFIFLLQGVVLSIVVAILWLALLGDQVSHRTRYLPRLAIFCVLAAVAGGLCLLNFFLMHTDWAKLWLIVAAAVVAGVVVLSLLGELYFRRTGKKYTEFLRVYQGTLQ